MADFVPNQTPATTPQQLAGQMWQVPQAPPTGNTLSGGVSPAPVQPVIPAAPVAGYNPIQQPIQTPVPPVQFQQPPQTPAQPIQYQQFQPPAQTPQTPPPAATRAQLDRMVATGKLSPHDAAMFQSDAQFLDDLYDLALQPPAAPPAQPQTPQVPQVPVVQPAQGPPPEELARTLQALQQAGAVVFENGRYVSKYPDFQGVAERANLDRMKAEQALQELSNPNQWLRKNGSEVIDEFVKPLKEELQQLRAQLQASLPKPHEAWIAKHEAQLKQRDAAGNVVGLTPAGMVYDQTYQSVRARGIRDPQVLHDVAAQAAEALLQHMQTAQPVVPQAQPQTPLSYAQAAALSQQPLNPGFNMPGTTLSRHQPQQSPIPTTNQNTVDFHGLAAGILNGSIPR
jgi:ribosomal protein L29